MDIIPILNELETAELWELGNAQQAISSRLNTLAERERFPIRRGALEWLLKCSTAVSTSMQLQCDFDQRGSLAGDNVQRIADRLVSGMLGLGQILPKETAIMLAESVIDEFRGR